MFRNRLAAGILDREIGLLMCLKHVGIQGTMRVSHDGAEACSGDENLSEACAALNVPFHFY